MSAPTLSVERLSTSCIILGDCPYKEALGAEFMRRQVITTDDVTQADYVLVWGKVGIVRGATGRIIYLHPYEDWVKTPPIISPKSNERHLFLGSIYDAEHKGMILSTFYEEAINSNRLTIPGDGVGKCYLISARLVVEQIVLATLHPQSRGAVYLLGYEYSLLTLAHLFRSALNLHVSVVFDPQKKYYEPSFERSNYIAGLESLGLVPGSEDQELLSYLKKLTLPTPPKPQPNNSSAAARLTPFTPPKSSEPIKSKPSTTRRIQKIEFEPIKPPSPPRKSFKLKLNYRLPKLKFSHQFLNTLTVVAVSLLLYLSSLFVAILILLNTLSQIQSDFRKGGGVVSHELGTLASNYLLVNASFWESVLPNSTSLTQTIKLLDGTTQTFNLIKDVTSLRGSINEMVALTLGQKSGELLPPLNNSRRLVETVYTKLSLLFATLPDDLPSYFPASLQNRYQSFLTRLRLAKDSLLTSKALLAAAPDYLGIGGRRQYALLFQNNMELRPTGGFIGSFAILSLDNGKFSDLPVYDVYQADGQLKGYVEPPFPIRKYLGEANWYLRDSNWDPNFPTTAERIDWYIKKTLNQEVDGVIGLNLAVIQNLIKVIGSLYVPEYDETITADNLYVRTQYHSEVGFFPGSSQKREFIGSLAQALMTKLQNADSKLLISTLLAILNAAENGDLTFYFDSKPTTQLFTKLGWAGDIRSGDCSQENCLASYLSVIDANLGVNKVNYYLKRSLELDITFDTNLNAVHTLTISQKNTATTTSWPAGSYKNYQRLYLPKEAELLSLKRDGIEVPARDIDTSFEHNKKILGYLVTTPISGTSQLVATYRLNAATTRLAPNFSFYWQKQPGTTADPLTVKISHPLYLTPTTISPEADYQGQTLTFNLDNSSNRRIIVNYTAQ